jgi:DNA (cytosine-5)-methyltransferase 1
VGSQNVKKPQTVKVHAAKAETSIKGPTCLDLFAGAGGLAVGYRQSGWRIVAGNDMNVAAGETFRRNFPEAVFFEGSVADLTAAEIFKHCGLKRGDLDCLIGGPPCQSFSYNNHQRSDKDARARLFEHYLRLVKELHPKSLVMENVPGILTIGDGAVVREIRAALGALGYQVDVQVLSAEEFGTPQVRRRVFIVASRVGEPKTMIPQPTHRSAKPKPRKGKAHVRLKLPITVDRAIGDLPAIKNGGGAAVMPRGSKETFSEYQREARKGIRRVFNHVCHSLTDANLLRLPHIPEGGNWRDIPRDLLPDGMKRARLSDHTKRYGRLDRKGYASTILTKCDPHWGAYIHPTQGRTISVREAARFQGFPDNFVFEGDDLARLYEQVGNAVPVPVAKAIGAVVSSHLQAAAAPRQPRASNTNKSKKKAA